jgi:ribonuclease-3
MNDTLPIIVFQTSSSIEADVVRGLLETHGIQAVVSSGAPQAVFPVTLGGLGEVGLSVHGESAKEAERLIGEFRDEVAARLTRIRDEFRVVEETLGYRFADPGLLEHALTHRSKAHEDVSGGVRDNESLEFLGDAVLGLVIADRLFRECPDWNEGQKSKAKAMIVSTVSLAAMGEELGLGEYLLLGRGEEKTGGRRKRSLIADTLEAVIAAIYLDGGIAAAEEFLERCFRPQLDAVRAGGLAPGTMQDHKSAFQEYLQSHEMGLPAYRLIGEAGPAHRRVFETEVYVQGRPLAKGQGRTKKESEQRAADQALRQLDAG